MEATRRRYGEVRRQIGDGDLLLFRWNSIVSKVIRAFGRSQYSHAGMAVWDNDHDVLLCCEVREWYGGRAVTLSSLVKCFPACIDVYRAADSSYRGHLAAGHMLRRAGQPYGYLAIGASALVHLPMLRFLHKPEVRDRAKSTLPEYCSAAVANAARLGGGVDPVPNLNDSYVEPGDLARSMLWAYTFTLI